MVWVYATENIKIKTTKLKCVENMWEGVEGVISSLNQFPMLDYYSNQGPILVYQKSMATSTYLVKKIYIAYEIA